ncbi:3-isopropylmalate dehydratase large subunit [Sciscionella marina]|uniref:3-isopropylmalate dehydratase large subunit n=1 Tax=Sciscionella marina TaxID=508770 RepID=UPI00035F2202|nr:aconitase/3-isopropylmalate dehydratase large subunit family protein [Sciscionella marina]
MADMTMTEKILAGHSDREAIRPGDIVVTKVDTVVPLDMNFYDSMWAEPSKVFDPDRIVVIFDHVVPAPNRGVGEALERGRAFAKKMGISRLHDVGPDQGICHQLIADVPYAMPGEMLVCVDSHTCSGGALNCAARGIGAPELIYVMAKGFTWFQVGETVRYELSGSLRSHVTAKDLFLHLADRYGAHVGQNMEFGGSALPGLTMDQRRTLTTMCAEVSAEFAMFEPDEVLERHLRERGRSMDGGVLPDPDAVYAEVRSIELASVEPMVGLPGSVVHNTVGVSSAAGTPINRAFIGSCANGTVADLREAAAVLTGRRVSPEVTLFITPGSQAIYQQAVHEGIIATLADAGAVVTVSSCGMCAGFQNSLGPTDVCIASSTRNFAGRMGHPDAQIYLGSSGTVAASAVAGAIADVREFA